MCVFREQLTLKLRDRLRERSVLWAWVPACLYILLLNGSVHGSFGSSFNAGL